MSNQPPIDAPGSPFQGGLPRQKPASMARYKRELRREIKRRTIEPEINFLNITAMLDMMTIILVFLLKTMAASTASLPQNEDMTLPHGIISPDTTKEPEGLPIIISKKKIFVGKDEILAEIDIPADAALYGAAEADKTKNRNDLNITPLARAIRPWRENDKINRANAKKPGSSEAIVMADESTPYRLLTEVLYTLGQNEFGQFHLMVLQPTKQP